MKKFGMHKWKIGLIISSTLLIALTVLSVIVNVSTKNKDTLEISQQSIEVAEATKDQAEVQSGTVTVYYLDEEGNELLEPTVKTGNVGDYYEVQRVEIAKYTKTGEEPITRAGYYELGNIDVKFIYKSAGTEVMFKVENEGEDDATQTALDVLFNNSKTPTDYGVRLITKDEKGNVVNGGEFNFGQNSETLKSGKVSNGFLYFGKIAITEDGNITYEVEQIKSAPGYEKINGKINLNAVSVWNEETKKFVFTSVETQKEGVTAYIDEKNNEIVIEVTNQKIENMYQMELVYLSNSEKLSGAKIKVKNKSNTIIEDVVKDGILQIGTFKITEEGTDVYEIYETEGISGYESILNAETPAKVQVTKTYNNESDTYTITSNWSEINGLYVEIDGNKVIIYVNVNKENDKYDLSMMKFISEIDGVETNGREPIVSINSEEKKFEYSKKSDIEQAANGQEITYRLRMYNESERDGKGKRIIEDLPDGLVYLPENEKNIQYQWKGYIKDSDGYLIEAKDITQANVFVTDYLVDKEIPGYNKEKVENAWNGNYDENDNNEYLNYVDIEIVLKVDENKIKREDRIIENTVTIQPNENDDNPGNDTTTEDLYIKYFDLDIKKYIKEVKVKNNSEDSVKKVGEENKGKLIKIDVAKKEIDNTTITVTYGLRVTNIGEIEGYATEIIDYIPADFKLVEDGIWKVEGEKAVTTKLENTLLQPGETTIIEITFEWKLTKDNIGLKTNEGKISEYENPYDTIDRTGENNDKEEMLVSIRTGEQFYYIIPAIIIMVIVATVIYIIVQKRNREEDA